MQKLIFESTQYEAEIWVKQFGTQLSIAFKSHLGQFAFEFNNYKIIQFDLVRFLVSLLKDSSSTKQGFNRCPHGLWFGFVYLIFSAREQSAIELNLSIDTHFIPRTITNSNRYEERSVVVSSSFPKHLCIRWLRFVGICRLKILCLFYTHTCVVFYIYKTQSSLLLSRTLILVVSHLCLFSFALSQSLRFITNVI